MSFSTMQTTAKGRAVILMGLLVASIVASIATVLLLGALGFVPEPRSIEAQKKIGEFVIRLILLTFLVSTVVSILINRPMRSWFLEARWRIFVLILFVGGALTALIDPFHPVRGEMNWIRYWTAGTLVAAGSFALFSSTRRSHPIAIRFVGFLFGVLLLVAGADEVFEFHERAAVGLAARLNLQSSASANDVPTLVVALLGMGVLGGLVLLRYFGGDIAEFLREKRYHLPFRLFSFSVITFAVAMSLDSFDVCMQGTVDAVRDAATNAAGDPKEPLLLALTDVRSLANSIEELLEFLASLTLLMMVGHLFGFEALGADNADDAR